MSRTLRFHLDENCDTRVARGLRREGGDVTTTRDAGLGGAIDEDQLAFAAAQGRVLLTHESDLVAIHHSGVPHPGIIYSEKDRRTIGQLVQGLLLFWEVYEPDEMVDRLEYL